MIYDKTAISHYSLTYIIMSVYFAHSIYSYLHECVCNSYCIVRCVMRLNYTERLRTRVSCHRDLAIQLLKAIVTFDRIK